MAKIQIELLSSACQRNEFYMEQIDKVATEMGLDYSLERVQDEQAIMARGAVVACQYLYCPGCWWAHDDYMHDPKAEKVVPAITINGELRFWDIPPSDSELRKALEEYK